MATVVQMQINLLRSSGRRFPLTVKSSDTIIDVKKRIFEMVRIPVHQQILMFNDMYLDNNMTLAYYNIQEMSTLNQYRQYNLNLRSRMLAD
jgi:hypothetical protein